MRVRGAPIESKQDGRASLVPLHRDYQATVANITATHGAALDLTK